MNTMESRTGTGSWFRPNTALLLSGTDNRRNHSDEVEELQSRAREYTRQQLEQMNDWDRAFYREWTSLISRNAIALPYPMGEPIESESAAQTLMATPIRGYVGGSAASTDTPAMGSYQDSLRMRNSNSILYQMEGILEGGTTTSESIQTTPAFQDWNLNVYSRRMGSHPDHPGERLRQETSGFFPEGIPQESRNPISFPYPMEGTLEDGTTTSGSTQTTIASRTWNSNTLPTGNGIAEEID